MTFHIHTINIRTNARDKVRAILKAKGLRKIGSGAYGSVHSSPKHKTVWKIGNAWDNDGYMAYLQVLQNLKGVNPFAPKIKSAIIYKKSERNQWFIIEMEKLQRVDSVDIDSNLTGKAYDKACRDADKLETKYCNLANLLEIAIDDGKVNARLKRKFPNQVKALTTIVKAIHERAASDEGGEVSNDMHSGNIMLRGKQVVITDPLA